MTIERHSSKKDLLREVAEASGLDTGDSHMEELYAFLEKMLPALKNIEKLDLTGMEPSLPLLFPLKGRDQ